MPKSTKKFILSNSEKNQHGFILLTSGADLSQFKKNPIMYWMHQYPDNNSDNAAMPIGFWSDISIEGDNIVAYPNFDDNDELALKIYNKVEHGTLRACSVGASVDKSSLTEVNGVPTYTKWLMLECSIVDRGANPNAVVLSFSSVSSPAIDTNLYTGFEMSVELQKIIDNSIAVKKFSQAELAAMLKQVNDKKAYETFKERIKSKSLEGKNLSGFYSNNIINQALKSYSEIERGVPGGFSDLKEFAYVLYEAKFFENFGRFPQRLS